jgi:hypothetical protein
MERKEHAMATQEDLKDATPSDDGDIVHSRGPAASRT